MSSTALQHTTVLLHEAVTALLHQPDGRYADGTFGRGGHSRLILSQLGAQGQLIAFDRDPDAVAAARSLDDPRFRIRHAAFSALADEPAASLDGILLDLGISSPQIDAAERGFSFRFDGPLDMRMDTSQGHSVAEWLQTATVDDMERIIRDYGEERFAKKIARSIRSHIDAHGAITRTAELANLVASVVRSRDGAQHPATRTFQALRIHINGELEQLELALAASLRVLRTGGRLVVISFHSLEDRIVKQFMAKHSREVFDRDDASWMLRPSASLLPLKVLARTKPSAAEVAANPRARSAIMRVAERQASSEVSA